jgi:hypothetical protein
MIKITEEHIDALYDGLALMRFASQVLTEVEIDDRMASELSWLLGSAKKRMEPLLEIIEELQHDQQAKRPTTEPEPEISDVVMIGSEVLRLWERFAARRQAVDSENNGEN